jgi:hypothetical protein
MSFDANDLIAALKKILPDADLPSEFPVSQLMSSSRWDKKLANPSPPADPTQAPQPTAQDPAAKSSDK